MAKFAIFASALAVLAPLAAARNCTPGLAYCGKTLTDIGEYIINLAVTPNIFHC